MEKVIIMIPLFAFLYNRGQTKEKGYSILSIFPYFVLGFVGMIVLRNVGDEVFSTNNNWVDFINSIKTIFNCNVNVTKYFQLEIDSRI